MENTDKNKKLEESSQGFNWKNRNLWFGVAAVLVLVIIIVLVVKNKSKDTEPVDMSGDTAIWETPTQTETPKPIVRKKAKAPNVTASATAGLTYDQAVVKYKDSRIQFDANCRAMPANVTFKSGAEFMLDNRAGVDRKISLNGEFTLPAYGFRIMKLSSEAIPRQYLIDCGDKQNVATILLQK